MRRIDGQESFRTKGLQDKRVLQQSHQYPAATEYSLLALGFVLLPETKILTLLPAETGVCTSKHYILLQRSLRKWCE